MKSLKLGEERQTGIFVWKDAFRVLGEKSKYKIGSRNWKEEKAKAITDEVYVAQSERGER